MSRAHPLAVEGHTLAISNPDKVLYPQAGFTKGQVIDFYVRISEWLLPHLRDRPVTLKRYPEGVSGEFFYEKDAPGYTPPWVQSFPVPRSGGGPDIRYILINGLATLVWTANLANLEIHPFLHRVPEIDRPTYVVFDLDPGDGANILACAEAAFLIRAELERHKLESFPKVSGSKGLQLYIPLNTPAGYDITQPFARGLAERLARRHPSLIVSEMQKSLRQGKVLIDWSQNAGYKTTIGVYSLRAKRQTPFVSLPVTWHELHQAARNGDSGSLYFQPEAALERVARTGDLFAPVLSLQQQLPGELDGSRARRSYAHPRAPGSAQSRPSRQGGRRPFVIRKHATTYGLRLEMHGVVKSWTVPKSIPYRPGAKRLVTEDHPGDSGSEATPEWDTGTYELIEGSYDKGTLRLFFSGRKLQGEWLLAKTGDRGGKDWILTRAREGPGSTAEPRLDFIAPMRARLVAKLPEGAEWRYEIKFDGYRALALRSGGEVRLLSRNNRPLNGRFPEVAQALNALADDTILDGEIVAFDDHGRPSFNALQNYRPGQPILYYVFDLLVWRGRSLLGLPLDERGAWLARAVAGLHDPIRLSEVLDASAADLVAAAREQGLEGIVAKRARSIYEPGQRSGAWVKLKLNQSHELVIGGYKPGAHGFEALLAGYYEGRRLIFIAKIKNGFTPASRKEISRRFQRLETPVCPFANLPEPKGARRGEALTAEALKKYRWLQPNLVAQIEFTGWTAADHLRHSRFAGLRDDKAPREVTRERAE